MHLQIASGAAIFITSDISRNIAQNVLFCVNLHLAVAFINRVGISFTCNKLLLLVFYDIYQYILFMPMKLSG